MLCIDFKWGVEVGALSEVGAPNNQYLQCSHFTQLRSPKSLESATEGYGSGFGLGVLEHVELGWNRRCQMLRPSTASRFSA